MMAFVDRVYRFVRTCSLVTVFGVVSYSKTWCIIFLVQVYSYRKSVGQSYQLHKLTLPHPVFGSQIQMCEVRVYSLCNFHFIKYFTVLNHQQLGVGYFLK